MIKVTQLYKQMATAPGRRPQCRIYVGDKLYVDDEILSFEFDDVVHPEELCFGSTCANRFHFQLRTNVNEVIPVSQIIRPYVSFEGTADEWCPLGQFYVTRRYRKGKTYSITAYDRMYQLDGEFFTSLTYPAPMSRVLTEICTLCGIPLENDVSEIKQIFQRVPVNASFRDVIGYIAGANGTCAKFNRYGRLTFKSFLASEEVILRKNYTSVSLKQDPLYIKQINIVTDEETFYAGEGTKLTTYSQYNPVSDNAAANYVWSKYKNFVYYGGSVNMQGLPYLEAGECVLVQDDIGQDFYLLVTSEIILSYNGALSGELISKSRSLMDLYDAKYIGESQFETIYQSLAVSFYKYQNQKDITFGLTATPVVAIDFASYLSATAVFNGQLALYSANDTFVQIDFYLNDAKLSLSAKYNLKAGEYQTIALHTFLTGVQSGDNNFKCLAISTGGTVTIGKNQAVATIMGQYLKEGAFTQKPDKELTVDVGELCVSREQIGVFVGEKALVVGKQPIIKQNQTENITSMCVRREVVGFNVEDNLIIEPWVSKISPQNYTQIKLEFATPVYSADISANLSAFNIGAVFATGTDYFNPSAIYVLSENAILLTVPDFTGAGTVSVLYRSVLGNIVSTYTGNPLKEFSVSFGL